jgi:transcriptional regulator with GAF, ATPase, and Fis domain
MLKMSAPDGLDENDFFRQAILRISSSLNIELSMNRCMDFLKKYIPISGMLFSVYDPQMNIARNLAAIVPPGMPGSDDIVTFPKDFASWMRKKWGEGPGVRIINDMDQEDFPLRELLTRIWSKDISHLIMDLELENKRLGSFILIAEGKNRYTEAHAHLVSLLHEPFVTTLSNILKHQEIKRLNDMLSEDNRYLHQENLKLTGDTIVGANFGLKEVMYLVHQVAPLESPVLLIGETGTGKEVIANAIHSSSSRHGKPYIKVNCGAMPESLIDSELFGHEKGAFTGAIATKKGYFERAHTGTIFLDEIGELPPAAQVRLLRVLQQHEIERVGGTESIAVDVRIISATHRNLEEMVRAGTFREDLWFRINVFPIIIPPLRQRIEDVPALVSHFLERKSRELKIRNLPVLAPGTLEQLQQYPWPGNVRELENVVERALILSQSDAGDGLLRFGNLPMQPKHASRVRMGEEGAPLILEDVVAAHIKKVLRLSGGKVEGPNGAAQRLGLHPSTLRSRMRKIGIPHGRNRRNLDPS